MNSIPKRKAAASSAGATVTRVTVTFQPTEEALKILAVAERANLNRSELLNALIEKHLPALLREQVSEIEEALRELRRLTA